MKLRLCTKCKCEKLESDFRVKRFGKDGLPRLRSECKPCEWISRSDEARERKRERDRLSAKTTNGKSRNRASSLRYKAKKRLESRVGGFKIGSRCAFMIRRCECCGKMESLKRIPIALCICASCAAKGETPLRVVKCRDCGVEHTARRSGARCGMCRHKAEREEKNAYRDRRLARKRSNTTAEAIWKKKVFALDGWRCRQCKCKVQKENIYANNAAELDHIVPLSKGGTHTYDNVQTLCRRCNQSKSDSIISTQLRMALV